MRHKFILFFIGLVVLIMGAVPLISSLIPAAAGWQAGFPAPGSLPYQVIITALGLLAVLYSFQKETKRASDAEQALAKLIGK